MKRILDVLFSALGLLVLLIPIAVISLVIYIDDPGSVLFSQERVGLHGKCFMLYKFRTMRISTPRYVPTGELKNSEQYITRIGHILRKYSLDEIPQLYNVMKGDMSLIGPRPLIPNERQMHTYRMRFGVYNVRPGTTGLAQINGRDFIKPAQKLQWDVKYLEHYGFWQDVWIFFTTIPKVFCGTDVADRYSRRQEKENILSQSVGNPMEKQDMQQNVSIIMPTYNCGKYIAEAIRSVQAQTYENWELWVVDDCSTDDTEWIMHSFLEDERIHYHRMEENGGPAAARNYGLQQAQGRYVAFLDSDDLWHPEKLEKQIAFMQSRQADGCWFSCTAYAKIDEQGNSLHRVIVPPAKAGYWKMFLLSDPIGNSTVVFDRSHFGLVQAPLIPKRNDYGLWLKMLRREGEFCYGMEESLMKCRIREGSVSCNKIGLVRHQWHLYRHVEKLSLPLCVIGMLCWAFVKGTGIGLKIRRCE